MKSEHKTVIIVTHNLSEAITMCNKIIVLSKRPSKIKKIFDIKLNNSSTPIKNRESSNFTDYYTMIWKEIDE